MTSHLTRAERATRGWVSPKEIVAVVLVAIALTFIVQNRQMIGILLFVPTVFAPLWAAFAGVLAVGLAAGYLLARRGR
ncbi:DUF1049 domain-containing protein [Gandjariella thermophila]|uniref:Lipopolysaccharide assembly protein A domain-containing protein n=1 Tax=Gandjariella thermophila TaxID=1931992 RepID=A0A4D4J7T6_9PSEU|nr:DUF1049 domain-containing protein [Gandjariella thermophila]GDY29923.1 hypothetical protein GTS_15560 [Gandjariella thermophila]